MTDPLVPSTFEWFQSIELGYEEEQQQQQDCLNKKSCWYCAKNNNNNDNDNNDNNNTSTPLSECSKCHVARYCSRDCQVADWKKSPNGGTAHKFTCAALKRVGIHMQITSPDDQASARQDIVFRIRFYACPYAVNKSITLGRGFLFLQGTSTLAEMSLPTTLNPLHNNNNNSNNNNVKQRSVLLHYLTLGEFDSEVCRDDFELATVRDRLKQAVDSHDIEKDMVVLMRFRCGHVAVGTAPLVPDYGLCKSLGQQYYGTGEGASSGAIQLNLDDV
eukprot:CAMPEP_0197834458 /NCGR_PEP_ID=MMETSP1437-20131217/22448_1 /TAXON_ID=49252 ORGANISM="Eucampia antarctica, Strain CCMP1452" /NCGR_SAMPLE_ID=MMETSP1437 /ASSEMBLY_ACC=CAM_ASM_001096 /LENGTH=273 /DNA_ID=CAMNT_0043439149 /DNA_START=90 /DNA_END=911 /DNA_ORIENTATION=+